MYWLTAYANVDVEITEKITAVLPFASSFELDAIFRYRVHMIPLLSPCNLDFAMDAQSPLRSLQDHRTPGSILFLKPASQPGIAGGPTAGNTGAEKVRELNV